MTSHTVGYTAFLIAQICLGVFQSAQAQDGSAGHAFDGFDTDERWPVSIDLEARSLSMCLEAAAMGDPNAMLEAAWRTRRSTGEPSESDRWLSRASETGSSLARFILAWRGLHHEATFDEAVRSLERMQESDHHSLVQFGLGAAYLVESGHTPPRSVDAHRLLLMAANDGVPGAQLAVGLNFLEGRGTQQSDADAADWLRLAAEQNLPRAQRHFGLCLRHGRGVDRNDRDALRWLLRAATQGDTDAQWEAVRMYRDGDGSRRDNRRAVHWLRVLAAKNHYEAQIELALVAPDEFWNVAHPVRMQQGAIANDEGDPVRVEGYITSTGSFNAPSWQVKVDNGVVTVNPSRAGESPIRDGHFIQIAGAVLEDGSVELMSFFVPTPTFELSYRLESPAVIHVNRLQRYAIVGEIENTSRQPIELLRLTGRLWEPPAHRDHQSIRSTIIDNLNPGERRAFRLEFSWFRRGTAPRCEVVGEISRW